MKYAYIQIEHNVNTNDEKPVVEYWANVYERIGDFSYGNDPLLYSTEIQDSVTSYLYERARDWISENGYTEDKLGRDV